MKYTKFIIKNYKGIPKIELDLRKKPNTNIFTLVGLNESGKTSLLEAISLFQSGITKENAHTLIPKSRQYGFNDTVSIQAELEIEAKEMAYIKTHLEKAYKFFLSKDEESIKITKKYYFEKSIPSETQWKETLWTTGFIGKTKQAKNPKRLYEWRKSAWSDVIEIIQDQFLPKILYYPDFLFKFPEKIYLEEFSTEGPEQDEYRSVLEDILTSVEKDLTLEADLLNRMKNKEKRAYRDALNQLLLKIAKKLDDEILKKWDEIFKGGQKKEVEINWDNDENGYFIELKIKQGADSYSINDRSLGFRWFFSFLIFTAFRKSRASDPGETLFLLDEPASNLHQRSQSTLLLSLNEIVSNCKLIYSTHSHHLINPKWLAGTYIIRNKAINYDVPEALNTSETNINAILYKNFVSKYPNETDHFKPILDALQYTPSKLEVVPATIFTEGKNDYYTFKYFAEIIFKNKYKLHFYPGAGVNKYFDVFRLYLAWDRKFIAIFDSDDGGSKAKKKYIKEIGPDIETEIFTLKDVNKSWKDIVTEDLFGESEQIKVIQNSFPEHKKEDGFIKSRFNTAIQELYINEKNFKFNKTTQDKFEKIFNFIKEEAKNR